MFIENKKSNELNLHLNLHKRSIRYYYVISNFSQKVKAFLVFFTFYIKNKLTIIALLCSYNLIYKNTPIFTYVNIT